MCKIPLVSTSYRSFVPEGVFLFVVNRKEGALQHRDRDILLDKGDDVSTLLWYPIGYRQI